MSSDPSRDLANSLPILTLADHEEDSPLHEGEFCVSLRDRTCRDGDRAYDQALENPNKVFAHGPSVL
jgi:hypothetical protein